MSRRRTPGHRDGLFTWTTDGDTQPAEIVDNPRSRDCTACHAHPGDPCTRAGRGGRKPIRGYHTARTQPSTQETT